MSLNQNQPTTLTFDFTAVRGSEQRVRARVCKSWSEARGVAREYAIQWCVECVSFQELSKQNMRFTKHGTAVSYYVKGF